MCAVENAVHSLRSRSEKLVTACLGHPLDNMEYLETLTVRRYLLSTNMLVIHLLTLSNNHLKFSTKEEQMDG